MISEKTIRQKQEKVDNLKDYVMTKESRESKMRELRKTEKSLRARKK